MALTRAPHRLCAVRGEQIDVVRRCGVFLGRWDTVMSDFSEHALCG